MVKTVGKFFFRTFSSKEGQNTHGQQRRKSPFEAFTQGREQKKATSSNNVHIDVDPRSGQKKDKDFKGGEYVEFEEVD